MSVSKTNHTKSTHSKSHATVPTPEEAPPSPAPVTANPSPTPSATLTTAAQTAVSLISQAQNTLPLTAGLGEKARKSALRLQMIPSELLTEAAEFLADNGERYPMFDGTTAQSAAQIEQSLNQVVSSATTLVSRVQSTVLEQRGPAVEQALALYAMLKAQSRTDSTARAAVARMEPLVNTRKTPHQKKEQRVKAKAKKLAELSATPPTSSAPPTATTESVAASPAAPAPPVPNGASAPPATAH
ncbi:MAG: hypothetical protein ACLQBL_40135 [Polyangiaceae bacterium]